MLEQSDQRREEYRRRSSRDIEALRGKEALDDEFIDIFNQLETI